MARTSSRSSSSRPTSRSASTAPARQAPPPAQHHAPPPAVAHAPAPAPPAVHSAPQQSGGMLAGLGATMAQGMAWGTGTAVARHAVDAMFSSGDKTPAAPAPVAAPRVETPAVSGPCETDRQAFMKCLQENSSNAANCDFYFNTLQACQSRV